MPQRNLTMSWQQMISNRILLRMEGILTGLLRYGALFASGSVCAVVR